MAKHRENPIPVDPMRGDLVPSSVDLSGESGCVVATRVSPALAQGMKECIENPASPYRTLSDLVRSALHLYKNRILHFVADPKTLGAELRMIEKLSEQMAHEASMSRSVANLRAAVTHFVEAGMFAEARGMVLDMLTKIKGMRHKKVSRMFAKKVREEHKALLQGNTVSLKTLSEDDDDLEEE